MASSKSFVSGALQLLLLPRAHPKSSSYYSSLARRIRPSFKTLSPCDRHDKLIRSYGQFAIDSHNINKNEDEKLQLLEILKADSQIVKGINYWLVLKAKDQQGMIKPFRAVVWMDPWNKDGKRLTCTEFDGPLSELSIPFEASPAPAPAPAPQSCSSASIHNKIMG